MSIESKVVEKKGVKAKDDYPTLKISQYNKTIVLFTARAEGLVVGNPTNCHPIGYSTACWNEEIFAPFTGKVTLKNKET